MSEVENDSWGQEYKDAEASALQLPIDEDGYFAVLCKHFVKTDSTSPHALYALTVVDDTKNDGKSTVKNMNNPKVLSDAGKSAGAAMAIREWKGAFTSAKVKDSDVIKCKNHDERVKLLDGKKAYIYYEPKELLNHPQYGKATFVTEDKYLAAKAENGKRMAEYRATAGAAKPVGSGSAAKKVDSNLDDLK